MMTDPDLEVALSSATSLYWRRVVPTIAVFLALGGISFGVDAWVGVVAALCLLGVGMVVFVCGIAYMMVLTVRQGRVRIEIGRRARIKRSPTP